MEMDGRLKEKAKGNAVGWERQRSQEDGCAWYRTLIRRMQPGYAGCRP